MKRPDTPTKKNMNVDPTPETLAEEFFRAPRLPTNTHEEWLLRTCAVLMEREARAVSVLEQQARQAAPETLPPPASGAPPPPPRRRRRGRRASPPSDANGSAEWTPSSDGTGASTAPSTGTGGTSWAESC